MKDFIDTKERLDRNEERVGVQLYFSCCFWYKFKVFGRNFYLTVIYSFRYSKCQVMLILLNSVELVQF